MPIPSPNVAVYTEGPLVTPNSLNTLTAWVNSLPAGQQKTMLTNDLKSTTSASDVATSGFNTIIIGLWHVNDDGTINFNDFPYDSNTSAAFNEAFAALRNTPGSTVETIIISFGGGYGVSDSDYTHMQTKWSVFKPLLLDLMKNAGADGVDWDYEPVSTTFDAAFITQITNEIAAEGYLVTAAPYGNYAISDWETVLEGTVNSAGSGNNFAWWNLQVYGPDTDYPTWVTGLQGLSPQKTGMSSDEVETFLVPGYNIDSGSPVSDITALYQSYPHLNGAFIWNFEGIGGSPSTLSAGIKGVFT